MVRTQRGQSRWWRPDEALSFLLVMRGSSGAQPLSTRRRIHPRPAPESDWQLRQRPGGRPLLQPAPTPTVRSLVTTAPGRGWHGVRLTDPLGEDTQPATNAVPSDHCLTRNRQPQILPATSPVDPRTTWPAGRICGPTPVHSRQRELVPARERSQSTPPRCPRPNASNRQTSREEAAHSDHLWHTQEVLSGLEGLNQATRLDPGKRHNPFTGTEEANQRAGLYRDYGAWLDHTASPGGCVRSIQLPGKARAVAERSGGTISTRHADDAVLKRQNGTAARLRKSGMRRPRTRAEQRSVRAGRQ